MVAIGKLVLHKRDANKKAVSGSWNRFLGQVLSPAIFIPRPFHCSCTRWWTSRTSSSRWSTDSPCSPPGLSFTKICCSQNGPGLNGATTKVLLSERHKSPSTLDLSNHVVRSYVLYALRQWRTVRATIRPIFKYRTFLVRTSLVALLQLWTHLSWLPSQ